MSDNFLALYVYFLVTGKFGGILLSISV